VWIDLSWFNIGYNDGFCEHGNEPSDYINDGEFIWHVTKFQFLRNDSVL
jgi:hypothetical protein